MKKLFVCVLLVCIIAMNVVACSDTPIEKTEQNSATDENTDNIHADVPCILNFSSLEEVAEFKGMLKKAMKK